MTSDDSSDRSLVEEIHDLRKYLNGVPKELKEGGAFVGYELRLQELLRTLALRRLAALDLPEATVSKLTELPRMSAEAIQGWAHSMSLETRRAEEARRHEVTLWDRVGLSLQAITLLTSISATATALSVPILGSCLAASAAVAAAALLGLNPLQRLRREQRSLDQLTAIRTELGTFSSHYSRPGGVDERVNELTERIAAILSADSILQEVESR